MSSSSNSLYRTKHIRPEILLGSFEHLNIDPIFAGNHKLLPIKCELCINECFENLGFFFRCAGWHRDFFFDVNPLAFGAKFFNGSLRRIAKNQRIRVLEFCDELNDKNTDTIRYSAKERNK